MNTARLCLHHFFDDARQRDGYLPIWEISPELSQIGYIADVIAKTVSILVRPTDFGARHLFYHVDGLEDGDAVFSTAAQVVHLTRTGVAYELVESRYNIAAMNIVPDLFAFISIYLVGSFLNSVLDEI
jgi:hypothetical protein